MQIEQELARARLVELRLLAGDPSRTVRSVVKVDHEGRYVVEFEVIHLSAAPLPPALPADELVTQNNPIPVPPPR